MKKNNNYNFKVVIIKKNGYYDFKVIILKKIKIYFLLLQNYKKKQTKITTSKS